mgnify:CR=1 FL=1|tara:strand:- start:2163 stop:2336 length:174 start_codon:yes stop_codon:yes gene_type:complete
MIISKEIRLMVKDIKKESGPLDIDSPNELTNEELHFIISDRLLNLVPKIAAAVIQSK